MESLRATGLSTPCYSELADSSSHFTCPPTFFAAGDGWFALYDLGTFADRLRATGLDLAPSGAEMVDTDVLVLDSILGARGGWVYDSSSHFVGPPWSIDRFEEHPTLGAPATTRTRLANGSGRDDAAISAPITAYNGYVFGVLQEEGADAQVLSVRW